MALSYTRRHLCCSRASVSPLEKDICYTALDVKDTYFHVDVHASHQAGSRPFPVQGAPIQPCHCLQDLYQCLSGSSSSLQMEQLHCLTHLDDCLIASTCQEAYKSTSLMLQLFSSLGVSVKSQTIYFIGASLDSLTARAYQSKDRFRTISAWIDQVMRNPQAPVRT